MKPIVVEESGFVVKLIPKVDEFHVYLQTQSLKSIISRVRLVIKITSRVDPRKYS